MIPDHIKFLVAAGGCAMSADNSQPWHFLWDGQGVDIVYDKIRVGGKTFAPFSPGTLLAVGSVIENINQAATAGGLSVQWENSSAEETGRYCRFYVASDSSINVGIIKNHPLYKRRTNRFPFLDKSIPSDLLKQVVFGDQMREKVIVIDAKSLIQEISELVVQCSEVRFQTQEIHEWLGHSLRFTQEEVNTGDGLDVATIDLPAGGGMFLRLISDWRRMTFLNKLGAYKLLSKSDGLTISKAPALIAIKSTGNGAQDIIAAGRLMCRIWIELNERKIAVQPFYVIADQLNRYAEGTVPSGLISPIKLVADKCRTVFQLKDNEKLQMLLRIGYPKREPPRSKRLPLKSILTDLSGELSAAK